MKRARGALLAICVLFLPAGGCSAGRASAPPAPLPPPATSESACANECGPRPPNPLASREVGCEGTLNDLCRAHCQERRGDASAALRERAAALEVSLEHDCGSGQAVEGELPREAPSESAPLPLDRLLRGD